MPIPIPTIQTGVVSQKVFINGTVLSNVVALQHISVGKAFNKIAWAKLLFSDGSVSQQDFPLSNDASMKPGNEIKIQLGYGGNVSTVFEGIIVKQTIKAKQNGSSILLVEAKDKAIKLTSARKSKYFTQQKDSDIITNLASAFSPQIDTTQTTHPQIVQFDCTDWDFIVTRAEANGLMVLTDDNNLSVKKPDTSLPPVLGATYGQNIYEFESEIDARRQATSITSHSWDYTQQQLEQSAEGEATFTENGDLAGEDLATVLGAEINLSSTGHLTQQQLQDWSNTYALHNHLAKCVGRVRIEGNGDVKPGNMISLSGLGQHNNGNVFVTGVLHQYDSSWTTDIQFGWREDWFYKKEDVMQKPAAGLLPGVNGLQIGVVLDLDENDPDSQFRIKVHVPSITSGNEGIWARVATMDAGDNRGTYFRPQVGDEVMLGFLNDDPREPIVLGYLHSSSSKSSPLQSGQHQSGIVTKEGLKIVFDDDKKTMTLLVPTGSGEKSIIINDSSGAMELKDENQNSIKMSSSGITIEAGTGNVTIKGIQVMIN